jgi:hypothetical protein
MKKYSLPLLLALMIAPTFAYAATLYSYTKVRAAISYNNNATTVFGQSFVANGARKLTIKTQQVNVGFGSNFNYSAWVVVQGQSNNSQPSVYPINSSNAVLLISTPFNNESYNITVWCRNSQNYSSQGYKKFQMTSFKLEN